MDRRKHERLSLGAQNDEKTRLVHVFEINPQPEALASLPINAVILSFLVKMSYLSPRLVCSIMTSLCVMCALDT